MLVSAPDSKMGFRTLNAVAYSVAPGLSRSDSVRLWSMIDVPVRFRLEFWLLFNNMWTACDLVSHVRLRSTVGQQGHNA